MSTLSSTATLTIADAAVAAESITVTVLPAPTGGSGPGRLVHPDPALGTFDYWRPPDETSGMLGAGAVIRPIWSSTKTLLGAANTLFAGDIRDVMIEERWTQTVVFTQAQLEMMVAMWTQPPDPSVAYVQWYPSYLNGLGFNVVLLDLKAGPGGEGITTTPLRNAGWVRGPVVLRMRLISQIAP